MERKSILSNAAAFLLAFVLFGGITAIAVNAPEGLKTVWSESIESLTANDSAAAQTNVVLDATVTETTAEESIETTVEAQVAVDETTSDSSSSDSSGSQVEAAQGVGVVPDATIVSAVSRKWHGLEGLASYKGAQDIELNILNINAGSESAGLTSEPRMGGVSQLRITFDQPVGAPSHNFAHVEYKYCNNDWAPYNGVVEGNAEGNTLVLNFGNPGLTQAGHNVYQYRVWMDSDVTNIPGQFVEFTALYGDTSNDGILNLTDRSVVVGVWTSSTGFSPRTDIDLSGETGESDRQAVVDEWLEDKLCEFQPSPGDAQPTQVAAESSSQGDEGHAAIAVSAVSRRHHSVVGSQDIALNVNTLGGKLPLVVEPRIGGVNQIRIQFDREIGNPHHNYASIEEMSCNGSGYVPYSGEALMNAFKQGDTLILSLSSGLENGKHYRVRIGPDVTSVENQTVEFMVLAGDASADGKVNATDRSVVVGVWTSASGFSARTDFDLTGRTDSVDRAIAVGQWQGPESCNAVAE